MSGAILSGGQAPEIPWTLSIWTPNEDGELEREVLWAGEKDKAPDLLTMSKILSSSLQPMQITDLAVQIVQQAPASQVISLLTLLGSCASRRIVNAPIANPPDVKEISIIDISAYQQLAQTSKKSTCGRVFKKGDIVWQCRQCGKDIACVQCDPCFRRSNHIGHEVYFHRSAGGSGCCDCGDPEAWLQQGNCCDHSPPTNNSVAQPSAIAYKSANQFVDEMDDKTTFHVPDILRNNFRAVMDGILGLLATYVICQVRSFPDSIASSPFLVLLQSDEFKEDDGEFFQLAVHNDDIHSYDEVIQAFLRLPKPGSNLSTELSDYPTMDNATAREYTTRIDKEGSQIVFTAKISRLEVMLFLSGESRSEKALSGNLAIFEEYFRILHDEAGLHVSFQPLKIAQIDNNVTQAIRWLLSVGDVAQGLRRMATRAFLVPIQNTPTNVAYQAAIWVPSELQLDSTETAANDDNDEEEYNAFADINAFDMTRDTVGDNLNQHLFPQELRGLVDIETIELNLSAGISGKLMQVSNHQVVDDMSTGDYDREAKTRIRYPFLFLEKNPLSLTLLAHPFLSRPLQTAWNDLVIRYQYDMLFKAAFAQSTTVLYPSLIVLFAKYRGLQKETVLRNTVQIYTANTVVESMSSQCIALLNQNEHGKSSTVSFPASNLWILRPLAEPKDSLFITNMLSVSFLALFQLAGLKKTLSYSRLPDQRGFIHHSIIKNRRYGQICRDLEYASASPSFCLRLLQGCVNPGTVSLWIDLCEALSFIDV